jgi:hypothetical protein
MGVGTATIPIANNGQLGVSASVVIRINNTTQGASFLSDNVNDWAATILHELGHAYWDLYGPGTSKIIPDGPSVTNGSALSEQNNNLIKTTCKL